MVTWGWGSCDLMADLGNAVMESSALPMNADLKGMVVIKSPPLQLVPFIPHRFG